jgi:hypothetical protein
MGSPLDRLTAEDVAVIRECLEAAVSGPFFDEWEFSTLIGGMSRGEVAAVLQRWPDAANPEAQDVAVNDVLGNLLGYPFGPQLWQQHLRVSPDVVGAVLARWRGEQEPDSTARGYFDGLK